MLSIYQCPVCQQPLTHEAQQYRCTNGHSFDVAKEGYVNLLLGHQKRSKEAGDSKAMLQSRRAFLEQGHYDILPSFLADWIGQYQPSQPLRLLDAGAGEGYYTGHIQHQIGARLQAWGTDIAKPGMALAAKRYPTIQWFVASSYRLPVQDHSLDLALRIYAPGDAAEFARVLAPGGLLITVIPGQHHLFGLKQHLYPTPNLHEANEPLPAGFQLIEQHTLKGAIALRDSTTIANLLAMTPYYWHAPAEIQQRVAALDHLDSEIEFTVNVYRVNGVK